jgi:hypothetical protein
MTRSEAACRTPQTAVLRGGRWHAVIRSRASVLAYSGGMTRYALRMRSWCVQELHHQESY